MLTSFIDRNLKEYYKIKAVINSCETFEHMNVASQCLLVFAKNCEFRVVKLKDVVVRNPFKLSNWKAVRSYREMTQLQLDELVELMNCLNDALSEEQDQGKKKDDEKKSKPKKPKKIVGINKLFK